MQRRPCRPRGEGFSLPEVIVAVAVAGILAGASVPAFQGLIQRSRLDGAVRQVVSDLRVAQSQAVGREDLYRLHSGDDPLVSQPSQYRLERSADGGATWTGVTPWAALAEAFPGARIVDITDSAASPAPVYEVRFTARGNIANPGPVTYPIKVVISGPAGSRTIQVRQIGSVKVL